MRSQRIKTTFHVIGIVLAMVCSVSAGVLFSRGLNIISMLIVGALLFALAIVIGRIGVRFIGVKIQSEPDLQRRHRLYKRLEAAASRCRQGRNA